MRFLLALLLSFPLAAQDHEWTRTDTVLAGVYVSAQLADWNMTRQICRYPELRESNRALGDHPGAGAINRHFLKTTVLDLAIAYLLKKTCPFWVSRAYLSACIGVEIGSLSDCYHHGLRVQFGVKF
jgi:hypothetical protein